MENLDLVRRLRRLRRAVDMLQADLHRGDLNAELIVEIEKHMDHGIATDVRCVGLSTRVDALRESTLTPRRALYADTARACEQLKSSIDEILNMIT